MANGFWSIDFYLLKAISNQLIANLILHINNTVYGVIIPNRHLEYNNSGNAINFVSQNLSVPKVATTSLQQFKKFVFNKSEEMEETQVNSGCHGSLSRRRTRV